MSRFNSDKNTLYYGATDRTRTGTNKSSDFKSDAATNYATVANTNLTF